MVPTRSHFALFVIVCSALFGASQCEVLESTAFGLPIEVTKPQAGQIQIFKVIYPPQFGLFNKTTPHNCQCSSDDDWYLMINPTAKLAVEAGSDRKLTLQKITEGDEQLWKFEPVGKPGLYYIINKHSGEVLEAPEKKFEPVLVGKKSDELAQQWRVDSHGRLYNGVLDGNLDVSGAVFEVGTVLQIVGNNGNGAQVFSLHKPQRKVTVSEKGVQGTELPSEGKVLFDEPESTENSDDYFIDFY